MSLNLRKEIASIKLPLALSPRRPVEKFKEHWLTLKERWPELTKSWFTLKIRWPELKKRWPEVMPTMIWLVAGLILSVLLAVTHSPLAPLPGVLTLLLVPGAAVLSTLKTRPASTAGRIVLSVCFSLMAIMVVGGLASLIGPPFGIAHPLNVIPESVIWFIVALVMLAICAINRRDPVLWVFEDVRATQVYVALAGGVLVLLSILGVAQLNHSGDNHLAVFATTLDVVLLVAGVVAGWSRTSRWPLSTMLYMASLALLLSTSLRGGHLYGWDIQKEFGIASQTLRAGVWVVPSNHDPYASMLSLTVLPTVLHSLVKLRLLAFFQLVVPAILALLPLAVFTAARAVPRWITSGRTAPRPGIAFGVVVGLIVSSAVFTSQLVSITRQAMALTMLAAVVMVVFDRSMLERPARISVGLLIVAISFTHYTTSYLVVGILLLAWPASVLWSRGWLGVPREKVEKHRHDVHWRRIVNGTLVVVAILAAFGWNLAITRNSALAAPSSAVTSKGAGLATSTAESYIPPYNLETLLVSELRQSAPWIVPVKGSGSVQLAAVASPKTPGVLPSFATEWSDLSFLAVESLWIVLGLALLYGVFRLGRRRSYEFSADLVGLSVAGLLIGGFLRFSGTLAAYYSPERAAIITAILLAVPTTMLLDDLASSLAHVGARFAQAAQVASVTFVAILVVWATGLGTLMFGGQPPGAITVNGVNVEEFTVSTPELATAAWLQTNVLYPNIVQTDLYGQLVLLSEPGTYDELPEIIPPEVDHRAYIYLSTVNLKDGLSQADAENGNVYTVYRSTVGFFDKNFFVVYSTGATRIYH